MEGPLRGAAEDEALSITLTQVSLSAAARRQARSGRVLVAFRFLQRSRHETRAAQLSSDTGVAKLGYTISAWRRRRAAERVLLTRTLFAPPASCPRLPAPPWLPCPRPAA